MAEVSEASDGEKCLNLMRCCLFNSILMAMKLQKFEEAISLSENLQKIGFKDD